MEDWVDDAAAALEKLSGSPLADTVAGAVRITAVAVPPGKRRYEETDVDVVAGAPGIPPFALTLRVVLDRKRLPEAGKILPARVAPGFADVDWDRL